MRNGSGLSLHIVVGLGFDIVASGMRPPDTSLGPFDLIGGYIAGVLIANRIGEIGPSYSLSGFT